MSYNFILKETRSHRILEELRQHLPFTVVSVAMGMALLAFFSSTIKDWDFANASERLFHVFHPLHMLFSAIATTAMFWRYEKNISRAVITGSLLSIVPCGLSDIAIPFSAGKLLGVHMDLHVCLVSHPALILPFMVLGVFIGITIPSKLESTTFPHAGHVFVSSMASLLYLASYGMSEWINAVGMVFLYTVLAVIIPCCLSDIILPLMMTQKPAHNH